GMVLRPDVVGAALRQAATGTPDDRARWPVIYLSPRGRPFDQAMAHRFARAEGMTLLCGRFEGVDQRVLDHFGVEEVSLGDFVLTGGEIAAQALIDATVRLIPRVLGNQASTEEESFSDGLLEHPHYTRPAVWEGREIPDILLSGHHAKIASWRRAMAERLTKERRPDLWRAYREAHGGDPEGDQEL
ncbi:MAG: tRNA (guanosine(37)-N1)-methyltransferase TrmD, partial [Paracoccaceae bacterium]